MTKFDHNLHARIQDAAVDLEYGANLEREWGKLYASLTDSEKATVDQFEDYKRDFLWAFEANL